MPDEKQHSEDLTTEDPEAQKKGGLDDYLAAQKAEEAWLEKVRQAAKEKAATEKSDGFEQAGLVLG